MKNKSKDVKVYFVYVETTSKKAAQIIHRVARMETQIARSAFLVRKGSLA